MRLLHELRPDETLVCKGEYHYLKAGKPAGQTEQWQITRLPDGKEIVRADVSGANAGGPTHLLTHLQRDMDGRPEWLRMRWERSDNRAAAQYTFDEAGVKFARQSENHPRRQEVLDIAKGYAVDYHPVIGHDYAWRAYPAHARGKPWAVPVFCPDLWADGDEILGGRALRFNVTPRGAEDLTTTLGDFEQARFFDVTLNDQIRAQGWFDEFGVPLRWVYPDKGYDFVLVAYSRPDV